MKKFAAFSFFLIFAFAQSFAAPKPSFNKKVREAMAARDFETLKALFKKKSFEYSLDPDLAYFVGLHFLDANDEAMAKKLFDFGWKRAKGSAAQLCAKKRISLSPKNVPISAVERYVDSFPGDEFGKAVLAEAYFNQKNYKKVILTAEIPSESEYSKPILVRATDSAARKAAISQQLAVDNRLSRLRLLSLAHLDDERFLQCFRAWAACWDISTEHAKFCGEWKVLPEKEKIERKFGKPVLQAAAILEMRVQVFNRNYSKAAAAARKIAPESRRLPAVSYADFCKACLFDSASRKELRPILEENLKKTKDDAIKFYSNFYLGRFFVDEKNYGLAQKTFRKAIECADSDETHDMALWRYLDSSSKISFEATLAALRSYGKTISSHEYFEDFFQDLSLSLLQKRRWNDFVRVHEAICNFAQGDFAAQFAYISARLVEEGFAKFSGGAAKKRKNVEAAFQKAFEAAKSNVYYRVLAAANLKIPIEEVEKSFYERPVNSEFAENFELESLLLGLAQYGFADRVFDEFIKDSHNVSLECAKALSDLLYAQGEEFPKLYLQSLQVLSYAARNAGQPITREVLQGLYPRPYLSELSDAASKFSVSEYVLYALARTESLFQRDIRSRAGAVGLTQLMPATARDVAKALRVPNYDLSDARTNLLFGGYYLSEMTRRLENAAILGLFAYNGGITRVRTWRKKTPTMPLDIFLETVPILETRDYGRKVLSAAVLYGHLYYDTGYDQIVAEIMK